MPGKSMEVHLVGFPIDLGADRRGVDMGPSAMRIAKVSDRLERLGYAVVDEGDIPMRNIEEQDEENTKLKYLSGVAGMSHVLCTRVKQILDAGHFPLIMGGDHSMSIGSLAGIGQHSMLGAPDPLLTHATWHLSACVLSI